ncbi:accessory factor UbiK family protein [Croceibacterium sp. TMG7-5b_MA50]|uniref:accessory factor UbiK family protein n=1 Tax=Croceibacterium sp. TMG7-5b_MA50 TaxID=3121290 RepID=UPI003221E506
MQSQNPFVADFVKLANSAAGTFAGMTREARETARERFKEAFGGMDFVSRDEFDAVKDMAARAREEAEKLQARVTALEAQLSAGATTTSTTDSSGIDPLEGV